MQPVFVHFSASQICFQSADDMRVIVEQLQALWFELVGNIEVGSLLDFLVSHQGNGV